MHSDRIKESQPDSSSMDKPEKSVERKAGTTAGTKEPAPKKKDGTGRKKTSDGNGKSGQKSGRVIRLSNNEPPVAEKNEKLDASELVFALDIGTRTVVGVVGVQENKFFRVIATEVMEHKSRAMLDGQIHDIEQVSLVAAGVKAKLEQRLGVELRKVAIAAAGRVLKTCQVRVDKNLEQGREIDRELVNSLEIEGIQRAQMQLDEDTASEDKTQFYCVGYSVINYYLNGYVISNLAGHKGKSIGADILATFLPLIVVDSLYTVMERIGLEVSSLTLEPIAAINATIPADLRLLNLALVDIGAGTSDIALTKDGSVVAYAMVPFAGDEITEKISQQYLVDFNTGEKIKLALSSGRESVTFTDILKKKRSISAAEVLKVVGDTVQSLATTIAKKILEYNHKAPNAVFLVGGGSRVPGLPELIAKQLDLPLDRVVVRGRDVIRDIKFNDKKLFGPESITPYGIALTAQMCSGKDFMTVTVNDCKIKLFNSKKLTVADALILYGFDAGRLIGRSGKAVSFTVNGEKRLVRGEYGTAAEIFVNGREASIETPIAFGDEIRVIPARDGKDALVKVSELSPGGYRSGIVHFNESPVDISTVVMINGKSSSTDAVICDGDQIHISRMGTLGDILDAAGCSAEGYEILINGKECSDKETVLKDGDELSCRPVQMGKEAARPEETPYGGNVEERLVNRSEITDMTEPASTAEAGGKSDAAGSTGASNASIGTAERISSVEGAETLKSSDSGPRVTVNGRSVTLAAGKSQHIFVDIFNYIDFDLTKPQGSIVLKLNGCQAAFTDVIRAGDVIEIYWNK